MRISEVHESEVRRRNVPGAEYEDDDEYITEDEYYDDDDDHGTEEYTHKPRGFSQKISNVAAALAPGRIGNTIKSTSASMMEKSKSVAKTAGNVAWIVTTSLILVGLPVLYAYDREKNSAAQTGQMLPLDASQ